MTTERATVHVVDDDQSMRMALSSLIRSTGLHVELHASADEFLAAQDTLGEGPACLVLDIRMPGMSGLELQRVLNLSGRSIPIIFITGHGDIPMTVRAMKAGAVEFLTKPFLEQSLLDAIQSAIERAQAAHRELSQTAAIRARFQTLSPREREVLALILRGLRNKQVAWELGISEVTVKVHRHNVMGKMKAGTLPTLISMLGQIQAADALGLDDV